MLQKILYEAAATQNLEEVNSSHKELKRHYGISISETSLLLINSEEWDAGKEVLQNEVLPPTTNHPNQLLLGILTCILHVYSYS